MFGRQLDMFRKKTMTNYRDIKREASFDLFSSIVLETPVDQGVLVNNWFIGFGQGATDITEEGDPSRFGVLSRVEQDLASVDLETDVFFTNNLPYAVPIEYDGISGQAPRGMVRVNTLRWDSIVEVVTRKVSRG